MKHPPPSRVAIAHCALLAAARKLATCEHARPIPVACGARGTLGPPKADGSGYDTHAANVAHAEAHAPANDDDPAGARSLRVTGEQLREALELYGAMSAFKRAPVPGFAEASGAVARRLEVALVDYVRAEQRLRTVEEVGGALG